MDLIFPLRTDKRKNETGGLSSALGRTRVARGGGGWRRTDGETEGGTEGRPVGASHMGRVGPTGSERGLPRAARVLGTAEGLATSALCASVTGAAAREDPECGPEAPASMRELTAGHPQATANHTHVIHGPQYVKKTKSTTLNKIDFTNKYEFELLVEKTRKHSPPGSLNRLR